LPSSTSSLPDAAGAAVVAGTSAASDEIGISAPGSWMAASAGVPSELPETNQKTNDLALQFPRIGKSLKDIIVIKDLFKKK
jgi:hypothetical protein